MSNLYLLFSSLEPSYTNLIRQIGRGKCRFIFQLIKKCDKPIKKCSGWYQELQWILNVIFHFLYLKLVQNSTKFIPFTSTG